MQQQIDVVDFGKFLHGSEEEKDEVARQVDMICSQGTGFFLLKNHGVPQEVMRRMYETSKQFFALPEETKMQVACGDGMFCGYGPRMSEAAAAIGDENGPVSRGEEAPKDLAENFAMGRHIAGREEEYILYAANRFLPEDVLPAHRDASEAFYAHGEKLFMDAMRLVARALRIPEDWFLKAGNLEAGHASVFKQTYYFSQAGFGRKQGQLRRGKHKDTTLLTFVHCNTSVGGLEVLARGTEDQWIPVEVPDDCFVVNIGDLLNLWTNGRYLSQYHRVANPPDGVADDRISLIFFGACDASARITPAPSCVDDDCPPIYEFPVSFQEWLNAKVAALFPDKKSA